MGDVSAVQTQIHKPGILQNSHDFANIFKAFIGANYLAVPFDFLQSGLVLGVIGLAIIAGLTDHCCHLIIKCKQEAVSRLHTIHHTPSKIDLEAENGALSKSGEELLEHFESTLTYGDIGQLCMGKVGVILVNIGLCITQLGFCSTYVIYLATTFGSFFPNKAVSTPNMSLNDLPAQQHETQQLYDLNDFSKSTELLSFEAFQSSITSAMNNISEIISNLSSTELYAENSTTSTVYKSTAPPFFVLILFPLPVFIIFAFIRNIRKLGPVSMLANVSLCLGFVLMFLYLLIGE
uniref:Proton-coupled amino acid transporter 1-like n=1 Tax=Saccoglossus kowalevskii TaxID=10224 RepID=A0ABM0N1C1_SACKO|nr:PREDICTED: proton-coupled amino acid transporter 1-like [Saccoglossus kowalevskii]